jgi:hypothetical protein
VALVGISANLPPCHPAGRVGCDSRGTRAFSTAAAGFKFREGRPIWLTTLVGMNRAIHAVTSQHRHVFIPGATLTQGGSRGVVITVQRA